MFTVNESGVVDISDIVTFIDLYKISVNVCAKNEKKSKMACFNYSRDQRDTVQYIYFFILPLSYKLNQTTLLEVLVLYKTT